MTPDPAKKVLIACPGVGHIRRGFETFTVECFHALSGSSRIKIWLAKGAGRSDLNEITIPNFKREYFTSKIIGKILSRDSYFVEQLSFSLALIPTLWKIKPDLVFFSDGTIGNFLWRIRGKLTPNFKLLFSNGGPLLPPYCKCDHIQQVIPGMYNSKSKDQTFLPYGFNIPKSLTLIDADTKKELRLKLGLPTDSKIILSVASLSISHKRIDYLINEVARLKEENIFLLLIGEVSQETPILVKMANDKIGSQRYKMLSVMHSEIDQYYKAADLFCHTALQEGFGRSLVEAQSFGLTVFSHNTSDAQYILGEYAQYADFTREGALTELLSNFLKDGNSNEQRHHLIHQNVYQRFSWDILSQRYVDLFEKVINRDEA